MSSRRTSKSRRGISLAELLLVLTTATVLIGLSAKLIHRIMHAHSKAVAFQQGEQTAMRLASQFRRDAHAADAVAIGAGPDEGVVTLTDSHERRVEYRLSARSVIRTSVVGEKGLAREAYVFPSDLVLDVEKLLAPPRVVFVLESSSHLALGTDSQPLRSIARVPFAMRVEACLARAPGLAAMPATKESAP